MENLLCIDYTILLKETLNVARVFFKAGCAAASGVTRAFHQNQIGVNSAFRDLLTQALAVVWLYEGISCTVNEQDRTLGIHVPVCVGLFTVNAVEYLSAEPAENCKEPQVDIVVAVAYDLVSTHVWAVGDNEIDLGIKLSNDQGR